MGLVILLGAIWKLLFSKPKPPTFNPTTIKFEPSKKLTSLPNIRKEVAKKKPGQIGIRLLFGSQTGTAEDFCNTLAEEAKSYNFFPEIGDLEDYDVEDLANEEMVVMCLATYGEGEPTDNAKDFYDWIMDEDREPDSLSNVKFCIFGLGNKTYEHFNAVGRRIFNRMVELGATAVYELGEGDDDAGLQEDFDNWKGKVWKPICDAFGVEFKSAEVSLTPNYELIVCDSDTKRSNSFVWYTKGINREVVDVKNPALCKVVVNRELHNLERSDRSCRHIEVKLDEKMKYQPGDHIGVFPQNDPNEVEKWIEYFNLDRNDVVKIVHKDDPNRPLLGPCTIERILSSFVDIMNPPKKKLLQALSTYTEDESEQKRLAELGASSEEGWKLYNEFVKQANRTTVEVLEHFKSCKPSFVHVVELLPQLQHRYYSISSSNKFHPGHAHITSVLVKYDTPTGRVHNGVCTTWLLDQTIDNESTLPCFIRTSTFRLPSKSETPLIMIGPGSGVAPFRGFLQERTFIAEKGPAILFFGCRRKDEDYLYEEELQQFVDNGSLTKLVTAFSREGEKKVYVQDRMMEMQNEIWDLLDKGAYVYVCGDAKQMAKDVHRCLRQIVEDAGGKSKQEAESFITSMQTSSRYQQDVWT